MDKRGVAVEVSAVVIIILTTFGLYLILSADKPIFIGDKSNNTYFDYNKCKEYVEGIEEKDLIVFKSKSEVQSSGFKGVEECI